MYAVFYFFLNLISSSWNYIMKVISLPKDRKSSILYLWLLQEEPLPYSFYINDVEIIENLQKAILENKIDTEQVRYF